MLIWCRTDGEELEYCGESDEKEHIYKCPKCNMEIAINYKVGVMKMDISEYASEWLSAESVSIDAKNPTKATVMDAGTETDSKFGKKPVFTLRVGTNKVKYRPSKTSIRTMMKLYGADTNQWVGKEISLISVMASFGNEGLKKTVVVLSA